MLKNQTAPFRDPRVLGTALGGLVLLAAALVLFSWLGGPEQLRSLVPGFPTMKLNTALGFAGIGGTLVLSGLRPSSRWQRGLPALVLVLAALTLLEYATGIDLKIDQSIVPDLEPGPFPGRMSTATATCFVLVSAPWLQADRRQMSGACTAILLVGLAMVLLPLSVYVYDPVGLFAVAPFASMAVHTSLLFLLCFLGTAVLAPLHCGGALVANTPGGALLRRLLLPLAAAPLVAGALGELGRSREWFPGSFGFALTATASAVGAIALLFWAASQIDRWSKGIEAQRQQAEDAHRQLMAVLDISADAILQVDNHGRILQANAGVEHLFEHPRGELVGADFEMLIPERFRGRHEEYFRRFSQGPDGSRINLGDRMRGLVRGGREVAIETTIAKTTVGRVPHLTVGIRDRTAAVLAEDALRQEALTDALTGIGNRRGFELVAERVFGAAEFDGGRPAVLLVDIDHFKRINDTHGHPAGDAVLECFAAVCTAGLRARDRLFRIGGEEFALLLDGTDSEVADQVAERIRGQVEAAEFLLPDGTTLSITCSIGVARSTPLDAGFTDTLARADRALYGAKEAGRNRVQSGG